jgi:hypothetical protein
MPTLTPSRLQHTTGLDPEIDDDILDEMRTLFSIEGEDIDDYDPLDDDDEFDGFCACGTWIGTGRCPYCDGREVE